MSSEDAFDRVFGRKRGSEWPEGDDLPSGPLKVERDQDGRIASAAVAGARGTPLALVVTRAVSEAAGAECRLEIRSQGGDEPLTDAVARIDPLEERATCEFTAGQSRVSWAADLSGYEEGHLALITGEVNGFGIAGVMDLRSGASSVRLRLEDWLEPAAVARLLRFAPAFREMDLNAREEGAEFEDLIRHTIYNSRWRTIGRAACWGLGGVGAGACCLAAPGIGCLSDSLVLRARFAATRSGQLWTAWPSDAGVVGEMSDDSSAR
jgi:hypothetical protein